MQTCLILFIKLFMYNYLLALRLTLLMRQLISNFSNNIYLMWIYYYFIWFCILLASHGVHTSSQLAGNRRDARQCALRISIPISLPRSPSAVSSAVCLSAFIMHLVACCYAGLLLFLHLTYVCMEARKSMAKWRPFLRHERFTASGSYGITSTSRMYLKKLEAISSRL